MSQNRTYPLLDRINSPDDLRALPEDMLDQLSSELREFIIQSVAGTGGHLAASLDSLAAGIVPAGSTSSRLDALARTLRGISARLR